MDWDLPKWLNPFHWFSDDDEGQKATPPPVSTQTPPSQAADPTLKPTPASTAPVMEHWADQGEKKKDGPESVVYLGINDASREKEKKVFDGMDNATVITGAGTDPKMQGKVMGADGKTVLDLGNEGDLTRYLKETGVGGVRTGPDGKPIETEKDAAARMSSMTDLFLGAKGEDGKRAGGLDPGVRDEMAGFVKTLQNVEQGDATMDRLIMSGHSTGEWVYSEAEGNPGVTFDQMSTLMGQFPKAQAGVQDFMLSACHTLEKSEYGDTRSGEQYQKMFPNVKDVWGYNGVSPSYKQGSASHIKNFIEASEGDDVDKLKAAAKKSGQNATVKGF
jgi:hypothetical protein